jgi:hypothetical protein
LCKISSNWYESSEIHHESSSLNSYLRNSSTTCDHEGFCEARRRGIEVSFESVKKKKRIPIYFRFPTHQKAFTRIFVRISILIQVFTKNLFVYHCKKLNEAQRTQINGELKRNFEKGSKDFERNPKDVNLQRFTVYFLKRGL